MLPFLFSYLMLFAATQPTADGYSFYMASFQCKRLLTQAWCHQIKADHYQMASLLRGSSLVVSPKSISVQRLLRRETVRTEGKTCLRWQNPCQHWSTAAISVSKTLQILNKFRSGRFHFSCAEIMTETGSYGEELAVWEAAKL